MIPRRSYTLAVTRPGNLTSLPAAKIAVFQACELDLTLRLPTGETFDGATKVRLEIHTSQTSDPDDVLTTFVVDSPTGNTLTLGLTGDYLNHTFTGPLGEFWLNIVAHWEDTDRIEPLRCANLFLHRHNASLTTPPPPAGLIPYVRFDIAQTGLTTQQKTQARTNISAASEAQANSIQTELTNLASSTTNALGSKADLGNDGKVPADQLPTASGGTWGSITGTLSAQTDLANALGEKADLVDGKVPVNQLPEGGDSFDPASPGEIGGTTPARATFRSITSNTASTIAEFKRADGSRALALRSPIQNPGTSPAFEFNPDKVLLQGAAVVFWLYQEGLVSFVQSHGGSTLPSPRFTFAGNYWDGSTDYKAAGGIYFVPNGQSNGKLVMEAGGSEGLAVWRHENRTPIVQVGAADWTDGQLNVQANWTGKIGIVVRGAAGQEAALQSWQSSGGTPLATITATGGLTLSAPSKVAASTVGTLPTASLHTFGSMGVTDALSPVLGSVVANGGSAKAVVRSNGTNWIVTEIL